jgi:hypothetical protein
MALNVETFFLVTVTPDGGFVTYTKMPEEPIEAARQATTHDVYMVSQQIVKELDQQMLVERIAMAVANALVPAPEPTVPDRLKDALKERGIDPESITPAN